MLVGPASKGEKGRVNYQVCPGKTPPNALLSSPKLPQPAKIKSDGAAWSPSVRRAKDSNRPFHSIPLLKSRPEPQPARPLLPSPQTTCIILLALSLF
ncbi:hypothetical protein L209DRAFT_752317 [Thermothelomyces heterothallicus CBS 203.75]